MPTYKSSGYGIVVLSYLTVTLIGAALYMLVFPPEKTGEILWSAIATCSACGIVTSLLLRREIRSLRKEGRLEEELRVFKPSGFREWLERAKKGKL